MRRHPKDGAAVAAGYHRRSSDALDVSVIAPVYRNRATLMELCERVSLAFASSVSKWELILVIDACPEGSEEALQECLSRYPAVGGLYLPENQGQNRAVLWGLTRARGRRIAVLDADLQDPPEALPRMLAAMDEAGAELLFARRGGQWTSCGRGWTSRVFKAILRARSGGRLPVDAGLFLVCNRRVADFLLDSPFVDPYLMSRLARFRGKVAAFRVVRSPRLHGTSAYSSGMRLQLALRGLSQLFAPPPVPGRYGRPQPWRGSLTPIDHFPWETGRGARSAPPPAVRPRHPLSDVRS